MRETPRRRFHGLTRAQLISGAGQLHPAVMLILDLTPAAPELPELQALDHRGRMGDLTSKTIKEALMNEAATTRLSSKGQVVIPEDIRNRLGLKPGAQFVVLGDRDVVILKVIQSPDMSEFDEIVGRARKAARQSGRKKKDVAAAVRAVRNRK